jgi:hypothetical protein
MVRERERGGATTMAWWRTGGAALGRLAEAGRKGERGHTAWWAGSAGWARLVR